MESQVQIVSEEEVAGGWTFSARTPGADGTPRLHRVTLSWADYNLWSPDGADSPARVAEAVVGFLVDRLGSGELREGFDASLARRRCPDADEVIPGLIRR